MRIVEGLGYAALGVLSVGVNTIVGGAIAALSTVAWGCRKIQNSFLMNRLETYIARIQENEGNQQENFKFYREYANKVSYSQMRLDENATIIKSSLVAAIPLLGMPLAYYNGDLGKIGQSLGSSLGGVAPSALYPLSGKTMEAYSQETHREWEKASRKWNPGWKERDGAYNRAILGKPEEFFSNVRKWWFERLPGSKTVDIATSDGRHLDAVWVPGKEVPPNGPTVLMFHGNAMTLDAFWEKADFFSQKGCNVLMVTMGGYPGSTPEVPTSEITSYRDVEAVLKYVGKEGLKVPRSQTLAYGLSMGGSLAFQAGRTAGIPVIADQTFTTIGNAANAVVRNAVPIIENFAGNIARGAVEGGIPKGLYAETKTVKTDTQITQEGIVTDNLNSLQKAKEMTAPILTLSASEDMIMNYNSPDGAVRNFAEDLQEAANERLLFHSRPIEGEQLIGGHGSSFLEDRAAVQKIDNFLDATILKDTLHLRVVKEDTIKLE